MTREEEYGHLPVKLVNQSLRQSLHWVGVHFHLLWIQVMFTVFIKVLLAFGVMQSFKNHSWISSKMCPTSFSVKGSALFHSVSVKICCLGVWIPISWLSKKREDFPPPVEEGLGFALVALGCPPVLRYTCQFAQFHSPLMPQNLYLKAKSEHGEHYLLSGRLSRCSTYMYIHISLYIFRGSPFFMGLWLLTINPLLLTCLFGRAE